MSPKEKEEVIRGPRGEKGSQGGGTDPASENEASEHTRRHSYCQRSYVELDSVEAITPRADAQRGSKSM